MITVAFNRTVSDVSIELLTKRFLLLRSEADGRIRSTVSNDVVLVAASFGFSYKSPIQQKVMSQEKGNIEGALLKARLEPMLDGGIEFLDFEPDVSLIETAACQYDLWVNFILETKRQKA